MTTKAPARPGSTPARPRKPPPTKFAILGGIAMVAMTIITGFDWEYGIGFSLRAVVENFTNWNPAYEGLVNIDWTRLVAPIALEAFLETALMAIIATVAGALVGLPMALMGSPLGAPDHLTYLVFRTVNAVIRSVPDLMWALIFVVAVGTGTLPGVLALFLFSIGVVAKLTADIVDGVDPGPIESSNASGAGHVQMVRTALVPQILPGYVSFSLYTFELNLRASAVLGLVGAGGIGELLRAYYGRGQYDRVWGVVVGFFIVVFVIERVSMLLRKRLV